MTKASRCVDQMLLLLLPLSLFGFLELLQFMPRLPRKVNLWELLEQNFIQGTGCSINSANAQTLLLQFVIQQEVQHAACCTTCCGFVVQTHTITHMFNVNLMDASSYNVQ